MSSEETALPPGWVQTTIGAVVARRVPQTGPAPGKAFTYIDISSVDNDQKQITEPKSLPIEQAPSRARQRVQAGDILVSLTRPNLNAVARVPIELDGATASTGFDVLRPIGVDPRWLFAIVRSPDFVNTMSALVQGALYPAVRSTDVRDYKIVLPPAQEQKRILDQLDELQARSRATKEVLESLPVLFERFRQSVLAAAFRGELTAGWRAATAGTESSASLLDRIVSSRLMKQGRSWKPVEPLVDSVPDVPVTWMKPSLDTLLRNDRSLSYGILKPGAPTPDGVPMLRVMDIADGVRTETEILRVSHALAAQYERTKLDAGDVLLSVMATVGRTMVVPASLVGANVNRAIAVLKLTDEVDPEFISFLIRSPYFQSAFAAEKIGSAQPRINLGTLRTFAVPLPPHPEQEEIVRRVTALLSWAAVQEKSLGAASLAAEQLSKACLAKAFRGELVPQDPRDAPASRLLERIRALKDEGTPSPLDKPMSRTPRVRTVVPRREVLDVVSATRDLLTPEELFERCGWDADSLEDIERFFRDVRALEETERLEEVRPDAGTVLLRAKR